MSPAFEVPPLDWSCWAQRNQQHWRCHDAPDQTVPDQGWKVHVSALVTDAGMVLDRVARLCHGRGWSFKHLRDEELLQKSNDKDADRRSSGKFITVYPDQEDVGSAALDSLALLLDGVRGPRILGDLQWRGSVVHVRWGAFRLIETWDGHAAVRAPDGTLERDRRGVRFSLPPWVPTPSWVHEEQQRLQKTPTGQLADFTIEGAYSFSNSGGVYRATHPDHGPVVLKEGREHVAVHAGADAAERVEREHVVLSGLVGSGVAPVPLGTFRSGGSSFLITSRMEGTPFNRAMMSRSPLTAVGTHPATRAEHARAVARVIDSLRQALGRIHELGVVHGDIAPRNVLVRDDGQVALVDFESASTQDSDAPGPLATPGFAAPRAVRGKERDHFSVACTHLAALLPLTTLFPLDRGSAWRVLAEAQRLYPTADLRAVRHTILAGIGGRLAEADARGQLLSTTLRSAITTRLSTEHAPATVGEEQGLERGVAGIHLALGVSPVTVGSTHDPSDVTSGGTGLASGRAAELLHATPITNVGAFEKTVRVMQRLDFRDGIAGIGAALLVGGHHTEVPDAVDAIAERVVAFAHDRDRAERLPPGLMRGPSGLALFLALHGRYRDDDQSLESARRLVQIDVARLERTGDDDGLQLAVGARVIPFLGSGSAGVGVVLAQLFRTTGDDDLLRPLLGIHRASCPEFTATAGLLNGRAGLAHLAVDIADLHLHDADSALMAAHFERHRDALGIHCFSAAGLPAFPDESFRGIDDGYGHGAAGVLTALEAMEDCEAGRSDPSAGPSFLRRRHR